MRLIPRIRSRFLAAEHGFSMIVVMGVMGRDDRPVNERGYVTQLWGTDAVAQINAHDTRTPLFLYLAFTAPHSPYQAPKEYIDKYRHIEDPTRRTYAAMITCMDDEIGKVVAALEKKHR